MLLTGVRIVEAGDCQEHGPLWIGLANLPQWPHDFVRGLIGGPHSRNHQMGPRVERRQSAAAS